MQWHSLRPQACLEKLHASPNGLPRAEAARRLRSCGPNALQKARRRPLLLRFLLQFKDFMVLILLAAAGVSVLASSMQGAADYADACIILLVVTVNAMIGVAQESRAEKALESLRDMTAPRARVLCQGKLLDLPAEELVPGDVVELHTGDAVPADLRLLESVDLRVQESALTGESQPVAKDAAALCPQKTALGDRHNLCFSGTLVTSGHGRGLVLATGMDTQVGHIARMLGAQKSPDTPLQKKLAVTGQVLGLGALALCAAIFVLGLAQGVAALEMFLTAVSLAVAAIPEGLPAVVTIVLASGVRCMAQHNAIIRNLMAVETLGSASVICSDKTGTLTRNHMSVAELRDESGPLRPTCPKARQLLEYAALCSNCSMDGAKVRGEPTEVALCEAAGNKGALDAHWQRLREVPFSSARKRMTVVLRAAGGGCLVITKGAPDVLAPLCKGAAAQQSEDMASRALRVLAVAVKQVPSVAGLSDAQLESGLHFVGLIGLSDPPRPEAKQAVALCKRAGIRPVMITGDHAKTAAAVARELGILHGEEQPLTGSELDALSDSALTREVLRHPVFARVTPAHKVRIVRALQNRGEVVAMTGDGVNDAPALKAADIGCAMGRSGTDVAKGAADMILADDNFATIVAAVREGRGVFGNIRRTVHFLLSCNVGELLAVFVSFLLRLPLPLIAIQLLWVNLVTDSLPALALGVEPISDDVMERKPVRKGGSLFGEGLGWNILIEGCFIGALSLLAYSIGRAFFDVDPGNPFIGRTMGFAVLCLSQLAHAFNMRSDTRSLFAKHAPQNGKLLLAAAVCAACLAAVLMVPQLAVLFQVAVLSPLQWAVTIVLSLCPIAVIEGEKALLRARRA